MTDYSWDHLRFNTYYYPKKTDHVTIPKSNQQLIDDAVREAVAKPIREAEIAKRVAAVEALGVEDKYDEGTVLKFNKKVLGANHVYVAIKFNKDKWSVTGSLGALSGLNGWTWKEFLEWMTTGESLVENVERPSIFTKVL